MNLFTNQLFRELNLPRDSRPIGLFLSHEPPYLSVHLVQLAQRLPIGLIPRVPPILVAYRPLDILPQSFPPGGSLKGLKGVDGERGGGDRERGGGGDDGLLVGREGQGRHGGLRNSHTTTHVVLPRQTRLERCFPSARYQGDLHLVAVSCPSEKEKVKDRLFRRLDEFGGGFQRFKGQPAGLFFLSFCFFHWINKN